MSLLESILGVFLVFSCFFLDLLKVRVARLVEVLLFYYAPNLVKALSYIMSMKAPNGAYRKLEQIQLNFQLFGKTHY